jgi:hypothetical protein
MLELKSMAFYILTVSLHPCCLTRAITLCLQLPLDTALGAALLDIASRVHYGIHHPIQYKVKVKDVGQVLQQHLSTLIGYWRTESESETKHVPLNPTCHKDPHLCHVKGKVYGHHA